MNDVVRFRLLPSPLVDDEFPECIIFCNFAGTGLGEEKESRRLRWCAGGGEDDMLSISGSSGERTREERGRNKPDPKRQF